MTKTAVRALAPAPDNKPATVERMDSVTMPLVAALENVWHAIRVRTPDVPPVVVTVGSGTIGVKAGTVRLGHFAVARWVRGESGEEISELFIGGEGLQRGALGVLGTLLHEAAHGVAHVRGIQDTSRQGRYHNEEFKKIAESMGLVIAKNDTLKIGWSDTTVPQETADEYAAELAALGEVMTAFRRSEFGGYVGTGGDGDSGKTTGGAGVTGTGRKGTERPSNNNGVSVACACTPARKLRMSPTAFAAGPVICGVCMTPFE